MATYEIRQPELDDSSEYDKDKLIEAIAQYNKRHDENHYSSDIKREGNDLWAHAIYDLKREVNDNMVKQLTTLEDTRHVAGQGFSYFPVTEI